MSLLLLNFSSCIRIPKAPLQAGKKIQVGQGTEDLVVDTLGAYPRLLISCDDRRHGDSPQFSGILSYDLQTKRLDTMEIREYPIGLTFRPHGLDIQRVDQFNRLYVVCHDDTAGNHWVACFEISGNDLYWVRNYYAGMLPSPNAVTVLPDGSMYVTNDHFIRDNFSEVFLKKENCEIIRFEDNGDNKVAYKGLAMGNGINFRDSTVYVAATRKNAVYKFDIAANGDLINRERIAKVIGPDNLRWDGDDLLVACHLKSFKFLAHAKNPKKHSPTVIYRLKLGEKQVIPVYSDKGEHISAGATGLFWKDNLYIGQVFEDWILEVPR